MAKKREFENWIRRSGSASDPIFELGDLSWVAGHTYSHNLPSSRLLVVAVLSHGMNPRKTHSMHYAEAHQN